LDISGFCSEPFLRFSYFREIWNSTGNCAISCRLRKCFCPSWFSGFLFLMWNFSIKPKKTEKIKIFWVCLCWESALISWFSRFYFLDFSLFSLNLKVWNYGKW
jgi:hypothetical protein